MMSECIFCMIAAGKIPGKKVYEDDEILAFHDINPVAPVHVLVIPKEHVQSIAELSDQHSMLIGRIHTVMRDLAKELGLAEGFRIVNNCGEQGGQEVQHCTFTFRGRRYTGLQFNP